MASLHKETQHGRNIYRVAFYDKDGKRRKIRLGEIGKKAAESITMHIQDLADASIAGKAPDGQLTAWLGKIGLELAHKLVEAGLIEKREQPAAAPVISLAAFLDAYIGGRTDVKPNTKTNFLQARNFLVRCFGADRALASVTAGDADEWRVWLAAQKLGPNSIRRHCGRARQFFRAAVRKRLIETNPFGEMKDTAVQANRARDCFVSRQDIDLVLAACPDTEWQLIVALARYGGLRVPSELLELRWGDINWERNRMSVRSPKTEHHAGKESRIVPLFPELRPHLERAFDAADEGTEFVITRHRYANVNLRSRLERHSRQSGRGPVAQAVREPAGQPSDGAGGRLPITRRSGLAGAFPGDRRGTLLAGD